MDDNCEEGEITLEDLLADNYAEYYRSVIVSTVRCLNAIDPQSWPDERLSILQCRDPLSMAEKLFHVIAPDIEAIKQFQDFSPAVKLRYLAEALHQKLYLFVLRKRAEFLYDNFGLVQQQLATLDLLA